MGLFSNIKHQKCIKEYEREYALQTLDFEQWKKTQRAFRLKDGEELPAIIYGDYISEDAGYRVMFLPDFSPNRWDYEDYLGRAVYIRDDYYQSMNWEMTSRRSGLKKIMEQAKEEQVNPIVHVRSILEQNIEGYTKLLKRPALGTYGNMDEEKLSQIVRGGISIVIPSKDHPDILRKCLQSIERTTSVPLEIIIIDNGSCKEHKIRVEAMCRFTTEGSSGRLQCKYVYEPMDFHFANMCNLGVRQASGEVVLLLNDDIEAVSEGWLEAMLEQVCKPYTGAVGMKLLYPDQERIQHAGIVNLPMGPVHKLQFHKDDEVYYDGRNRGVHNVSAVTGACLMMKKALYEQLGGMSVSLPVAFNDVELCFHAMEKGYYNVVCCDHYLIHHESISRGQDTTEEKRSRLLRERSKLYEMHPEQSSKDAYYVYNTDTNYGLCHAYLDTAIRPAYEDGIAKVQKVDSLTEFTRYDLCKELKQKKEHEKLNPCLKISIEQLYQEGSERIHVAGNHFVIGSDNCHFEHRLVLMGEQAGYMIPLKPVKRQDLERNMPDQLRVGLSGFHVEIPIKEIKKGRYKLEIYTVDKTSTLRLRQSSNVWMYIKD